MTQEESLLTRTLRLGKSGKDVTGVKRTVYSFLDSKDGGHRLADFDKKGKKLGVIFRRTYGVFFIPDVNKMKKANKQKTNGQVSPEDWDYWVKKGYPDAYSIKLMNDYIDELPKPKPPNIPPRQGYDSLEQSLHELFSIGRRQGFSDLGTYNPNSKLPSGRPSDHAHYPAKAFDLGFSPQTGQSNPKAHAFFTFCTHRPEVKYVICGNEIWSPELGVHGYHDGGHEGHVHVSGY